jgi:phage-related protein
LTEISNVLGNIVNESANSRNALLTSGLSSGWKQLLAQGVSDGEAFSTEIKNVARDQGIAVDQMIESAGSFEDSLSSGWVTSDILAKALDNLTQKTSGYSAEQLKDLGYTQDQVDALAKLNEQVKSGAVNLDNYAKKMTMMSGRQNLVEALRNSFEALMAVLKSIKEAFREVFPAATGKQLYDLTVKIKEFTASLRISDETAGLLRRTFEGFFSLLDIGKQILSGFFSLFGDGLKSIAPAGNSFLSITASIGDFISSLDVAIKKSGAIKAVFAVLSSIVETAATVIKGSMKAIASAISGVKDIDLSGFDDLGERIKARLAPISGLSEVFSKIGEKLKAAWSKIEPVFEAIGNKIGEVLGKFKFSDIWDAINAGGFATMAVGIKKFFDSAKKSVESFGKIPKVFEELGNTLQAFQTKIKAGALQKIAISIGILAASLVALSLIDSDKLAKALGALGTSFGMLLGSLAVLEQITKKLSKKELKNIKGVMVPLIEMAIAVDILASAAKKLGSIDKDKLLGSTVAVLALVAGLTASAKVLSKDSGSYMKGAAGLIMFALAVDILASAVKKLGSLDMATIGKGLAGVGALIAGITISMNYMPDGKKMTVLGLGIVLFASGVAILGKVVESLGQLDMATIGKGLLAMGGAITALAVAMNFIPDGMVGKGLGLVLVAASLAIVGKVLGDLGRMDMEQIGKGLLAMGGALAEIVIALDLMKGALPGAAALLIVSAALLVLSGTIAILGALPTENIVKGLLALAAGLAVILGIAGILMAVPALAVALLALAVAVGLLGAACLAIGSGLALFALGLTAIVGLGAAGVAAITALVGAIAAQIPNILAQVAQGMIQFGLVISQNVPALVAAFSAMIDAFIQSVVNKIPEIVDAFLKMMTAVLDSLETYVPQMVDSGMKIIQGFLQGVADNIESVVEAGIEIAVNFINGVSDKIGDVIQAGVNLVLAFINGVADAIRNNVEPMKAAMKNLISAMMYAANELVADPVKGALGVAKNIIDGLVNGITNGISKAVEAAKNLGQNVLDGIKGFFGIHSPSTVMRDQVGNYIVQGIAEGITSDMSAEEAAKKKAENIVSAFKDEFDKADMKTSVAELEYKLWTALNGDSASMADQNAAENNLYIQKLNNQAQKVEEAQAQMNLVLQAVGGDKENQKYQEAYKTYMQYYLDYIDIQKDAAKAQTTQFENQEKARKAYEEDLKNAQDAVNKGLITQAQAESYAKQQSGYDPNATQTVSNLTQSLSSGVKDSVTSAMSTVKSTYAQTAKTTFDAMLPNFTQWGADYAKALGDGFTGTFDTIIDKITDSIEKLETEVEKKIEQMIQDLKNAAAHAADEAAKGVDTGNDSVSAVVNSGSSGKTSNTVNALGTGWVASTLNAIASSVNTAKSTNSASSQKASVSNSYNYTQNNYSPKALSRVEIYRQTNNQLSTLKGAVSI